MIRSPVTYRRAALGLVLALLAGGAAAGPRGGVTVQGAWTRPSALGANAALYLAITARVGDRLIGEDSPAAARVSIHESRMVGAMMTMRSLPALALPPGVSVRLAPGGLHLMLEGLRRPLKIGDRGAITLRFEHAGSVPVVFHVRLGPHTPGMTDMKM